MYSRQTSLKTPTDFNFPFEPYEIQQNLMQALYGVLEQRQIGIFESPTGTGKSLTLTCGALKWLQDHNSAVKLELIQRLAGLRKEIDKLNDSAASGRDWIETQAASMDKSKEVSELRMIQEKIDNYEKKIKELKERQKEGGFKDLVKLRKRVATVQNEDTEEIEDDMELQEYDAEEQDEVQEEEHKYKDTKIFFCSRTHSQLAQIAREIQRTAYATDIRCISLASRQNLCINPSVTKLQSSSLINERCLDMQRASSKATATDTEGKVQKRARLGSLARCPYKTASAVEQLRNLSLTEIADIEDLVSAGETLNACPYYSSRDSLKDAQIVLLPYHMLLHKKTRIQTGIELKNSIVIIDEAHNLLDTLSDIYSNEITLAQLQLAKEHLTVYQRKYASRFSTKNLLSINQLIFITTRLVKLLSSDDFSGTSRLMRTHQLMAEGEFYNIDLFQLLEFAEQSRLAQKVHGCAQREERIKLAGEKENDCMMRQKGASAILRRLEEERLKKPPGQNKKKTIESDCNVEDEKETKCVKTHVQPMQSALRPLLAFLESLTENSNDGQVLLQLHADPKEAGMKFLLLDPSWHFNELVQKCRSIIIAGGTMRPTEELISQLFPIDKDRVKEHFYDHVVPIDAVLPYPVRVGPSGKKFNFNFQNRKDPQMIGELGMTLQNICNVVPAGIVCFFSSYDYLDYVYKKFDEKGIIENIAKRKYVFQEPRAAGQQVEKILAEYAVAVSNPSRRGAILFSVVGGKLSEGLNFTDDLGRCVVVVGMPYPNIKSPEIQEKMKYLDDRLGSGSGTEYYENLCMKAVNQCIGRSVRHINDYAVVLLIDERYGNERVRNKLPQWISRNLVIPAMFAMVQGSVARFFRNRKNDIIK